MPDKQIFFDPHRKRWKRLRRIFDVTAVLTTLVLAGFIFNVSAQPAAAGIAAAVVPAQLQGAAGPDSGAARGAKAVRPARRKTTGSLPIFPSTPARVCARLITCLTTRRATLRSSSTFTRSTCCFLSGCMSTHRSRRWSAIDNESHRAYPVVDGNYSA